jgi:hypothetical protein
MGMKCNMETLIGQEPETKFDVTKISLKCHENLTKLTQTSLQYQLMQMLLKSLEIFRTFLLQDQKLLCKMSLFGTNGKMVIALDLVGSLNGIVYLAGFQI